jgi:transposase
MKKSKKQVENSILTIAKLFGIEENYNAVLKISSLPEVVKMITYDMFLNRFDSRSCSDELYNAWIIIFIYGQELKSNGFVIFN